MGRVSFLSRIRLLVLHLRYKLGLLPVESKAGVISINSMYSLLWREFPKANINVRRAWYRLCDDEMMVKFLETDTNNLAKYDGYEGESYYTCVNYADGLQGEMARRLPEYAHGKLQTHGDPGHELNFYVNTEMNVKYVEPQSDAVHDTLDNWQGEYVERAEA